MTTRRLGHGGTRTSLFVGLAALKQAARIGWGEYTSSTDERIVTFRPELFPMYAEMFMGGVLVDPDATTSALEFADAKPNDAASIERARRATSTLVRSARFREDVVSAYGGLCAMCGLGLGIVQGAHIYPASAPGSMDTVQNGLALCPSHHAAFDRYMLCVEPRTRRVLRRDDFVGATDAETAFVASTRSVLVAPATPAHQPDDRMLRKRVEYLADAYSWAL